MVYLEQFAVPDLTREDDYMYKCGNGCGKTTLLNVITQKLGAFMQRAVQPHTPL